MAKKWSRKETCNLRLLMQSETDKAIIVKEFRLEYPWRSKMAVYKKMDKLEGKQPSLIEKIFMFVWKLLK